MVTSIVAVTSSITVAFKGRSDSLNKGEYIQRQNQDMNMLVWNDQKAMWLLYNHCSPNQTSILKRWNKSNVNVQIVAPKAVVDYFYKARSVDVVGQFHYSYPQPNVKYIASVSWVKTIARELWITPQTCGGFDRNI